MVDFHEIPESRTVGFDPPVASTHWVCEGEFDDYVVANMALSLIPTHYLHPRGLLYRDECTRLEIVYQREETYNRTLGPSDNVLIRLTLATLGDAGYTDYDDR